MRQAKAFNPDKFNVEGDYNYGWTFLNGEKTIYYPAAGRHSFSPSLVVSARNFTNIINDEFGVGHPVGFYWSADARASLEFNHNSLNIAVKSAPRAGGFPVRCVAE